jgi:hypothetical protein
MSCALQAMVYLWQLKLNTSKKLTNFLNTSSGASLIDHFILPQIYFEIQMSMKPLH